MDRIEFDSGSEWSAETGNFRGNLPPAPDEVRKFQELIRDFYRREGRTFPWRHLADPYLVLVSEFMLQQTQTSRVESKFAMFRARFPTVSDLAGAPLGELLILWQGLGYNRRAKFLHETARTICDNHGGIVPDDPVHLQALPGIGSGTAGAIVAYAYNRPVVFLETNIRRVYLHLFFGGREAVRDSQILPIIGLTMDRDNPRDFYYALTDFGVYLKSRFPNSNRRSAHYTRQSRFENSSRQVRGAVLRVLATPRAGTMALSMTAGEIVEAAGFPDERIAVALRDLEREGMVVAERTPPAGRATGKPSNVRYRLP